MTFDMFQVLMIAVAVFAFGYELGVHRTIEKIEDAVVRTLSGRKP